MQFILFANKIKMTFLFVLVCVLVFRISMIHILVNVPYCYK